VFKAVFGLGVQMVSIGSESWFGGGGAIERRELFGWKFLNDSAKFHRERKLGMNREAAWLEIFLAFFWPLLVPQ
jgi:hypothetical protein